MQRVKRRTNIFIQNNNNTKFQQENSIKKNISNGNYSRNIETNTYLNNNIITFKDNKFLSFPEKQKIIDKINSSKNQFNLYQPLKKEINKNEDNKNILYIKKTKSNLNLLDKKQNKSGNINTKKSNSNMGHNQIKFTENKNLVNKTIKEYYKKNENPFKDYLKSLNNDTDNNKTKNYQKSHYIKPTNFYSNYNISKEKNIHSNEIYKKPISSKLINKTDGNNMAEYQKNSKYKNEDIKNINSSKLYITNIIDRKEKINWSKMRNNNGIKKNIFNNINNYNTNTIKNNTIIINDKKHKSNNNLKKYLTKNNTSVNFTKNINSNTINIKEAYNKDYLHSNNNLNQRNTMIDNDTKHKTLRYNKSLNLIKSNYYKKGSNNNNLSINEFYNLNYNTHNNQFFNKQNQKNLSININNNNSNYNIKYIKKSILSPNSLCMTKERITNFYMNNDLPRILVEKDIINFIKNNNISNLENENNEKTNNIKKVEELANYTNYNFYSDRENVMYKEKKIKEKNINFCINTEVKKRRNKSLSLTLELSLNKEKKRNKSFSLTSNRDNETEDNDYFFKNGNNNYKYKNGSYKTKSKNNKINSLVTKEICLPITINRSNSYYYNSDDDIMNSNNNSNIGTNNNNNSNNVISGYYNNTFDNLKNHILFNNNNYKIYSKSNNNIFSFHKTLSPSPTKDYYFNYLSNKINNDFLSENTFNKNDKNLFISEFLNKNTFCEKCKRNYCPYCCRLSPEFDIDKYSYINKKIAALKYLNKGYYPSTIHSKTITNNFERNNLKNNIIKNNIERYKEEEENNIKTKIITNYVNLKLDNSNGKHISENIIQNCNNNQLEGSSFNSNKNEIIDNINNNNIKNDLSKNEEKTNKDNIINQNNENNKAINEIKDKDIIIENEIKNKKDSEIDKNDQIKSISIITSSDRFIIKGEGISLSNSEFILNENSNNENTNQTKIRNNNLSKDKEEKENKPYINMTDIIQNIQVTPTTKINSYIKEFSINNDNNFTKTDADTNVNNNTGIIIKNFSIKDEFINKNYINKKNQSESPILSDILEFLNIISPQNYFVIKNKLLNLIINKEKNISISFVNILYPIAINQKKYQPIYAKLCRDIDKIDKCHCKKDKNKSIIRTQLMKFCKSNFKKIKVCLENIKYIENDINFIGELINAQMVSKKVGIQCLTHLINKFNQYNNNKKIINNKDEKYLYLNCIINLLNQFGTCINYYQKDKIRKEELLLFQKDINNNIILLNEIVNNKKNKDMPNKIKFKLIELIEKSKNNWEITLYEQSRYQFIKSIYEEINTDNINNNINSINIKFEKNENIYNNNNNIKLNKQSKSMSPNNNKNNIIVNINNAQKKLSGYSEIIKDNLTLFKRHIIECGSSDNFKDWEKIDNLFLNKKIKKSVIFSNIINAAKYFLENKNDIYYLDNYIKIIFEYYYNYLNKGDLNEIINILLKELSYLTNKEINKEENKYIIQIWIVIIYYLLQNKIISMSDFDYFSNGYNNEIKNNVFIILNGVCNYDINNKQLYLKELTNTKFINMNKNILSINIDN